MRDSSEAQYPQLQKHPRKVGPNLTLYFRTHFGHSHAFWTRLTGCGKTNVSYQGIASAMPKAAIRRPLGAGAQT